MRFVVPELECVIVAVALKVAVHLIVILAHVRNAQEGAPSRQISTSQRHVATTNDQLTEIVDTVVHMPCIIAWLSHAHC